MASSGSTPRVIGKELAAHAPFTVVGALTGIGIMAVIVVLGVPRFWSETMFWTFHPLHVLLSALATTGMYRRHGGGKLWATILVGYLGSVGIATLTEIGRQWGLVSDHRCHVGRVFAGRRRAGSGGGRNRADRGDRISPYTRRLRGDDDGRRGPELVGHVQRGPWDSRLGDRGPAAHDRG